MTKIRLGARPLFLAAAYMATTPFCTLAQTPATNDKPIAFEVVSIRVVDPNSKVDHNNPNDASNQPQTFPSNRLTMRYIAPLSLICAAYIEIQCGNVVGGPPWLHTNEVHYDISAKVEGNAMLTRDQMKPMLRTLLEERFHLKVHSEQRILPGYALVVAKSGSKLQPNKPASKDGGSSSHGTNHD